MPITDITLLLSISQAFFLVIAAYTFQRHSYVGKLLIVFAFSMLGYFYLVLMTDQLAVWEIYLLTRVSYLIPGVIWLLAFALFRHEKPVPLYAWMLIASYFGLRAIGGAYYSFRPEEFSVGVLHTLTYIVPQIINIGIYIHTLGLVVLEHRQDLIEERRSLRGPFVAVLGTFWLLVAVDVTCSVLWWMGVESIEQSWATIQVLRSVLSFPVALAVNLILFRINTMASDVDASLFSRDRRTAHGAEAFDSRELALRDRLLKVMEVEKIYCQPGLTIGKLAEHLHVQEYKLRSVINRVMKFNNFSHFLNKYRVREAEERLLATDDSITNIGVDVGYASFSSFHKAFREAHGITPKEFRILNRRAEATGRKSPAFA